MEPAHHLDASSTAVVTDSTTDVPPDQRPPNWRVVPMPVSFGAETFADGVDIDAAGFYERLARTDRLPTTSQPATGLLVETLRDALATHETAVVLPLSGRMSGTAEGFRAAVAELGDDGDRAMVLESKSVTIALGLLTLRLQALLERGCTAAEAQAAMARLSDAHRIVFSLETLEFLQRGGRIGRAQAVAGSLLRVRPILQFDDGEVAPHSRVRGSHRVMPAMREYLEQHSDPVRPLRVALGHTRRPEVLGDLEEMVRAARPRASIDLISEIGPTVGTHAGPGAYAVAFVHDPLDG